MSMTFPKDKISELQCSVADIESDQSQVEHLFGRGPEKDGQGEVQKPRGILWWWFETTIQKESSVA